MLYTCFDTTFTFIYFGHSKCNGQSFIYNFIQLL